MIALLKKDAKAGLAAALHIVVDKTFKRSKSKLK
jgi:hypothetical protein